MGGLSTHQLYEFLDRGYYVFQPEDVPAGIHDRLFEAAERLYAYHEKLSSTREAINCIADDIQVREPLLHRILESDHLDAVLTSVLGRHYYRYSHSFIHRSSTDDQSFHKDSGLPWGLRGGIRSHRPNWAMIFYYPQETSVRRGATQVLPGTQYWTIDKPIEPHVPGEDRLGGRFEADGIASHGDLTVRDAHLQRQIEKLDGEIQPEHLTVPKGSLALVHFDLFHRGTRNLIDEPRFMYKFWYVRTLEPDHRESDTTITYAVSDARRVAVIKSIANWMQLDPTSPVDHETEPDQNTEARRIDRAYRLGVDQDIESLVVEFSSPIESVRRAATYGLASSGDTTLARILENIYHDEVQIRINTAFLIGEIGAASTNHQSALSTCMKDPSSDVRTAACTAIGKYVRRNATELDEHQIARLIEMLLQLIRSSKLLTTRRVVWQSGERQAAYIALLMAVTASIDSGKHTNVLERLARQLSRRLKRETDRYARSTCTEILARLAEAGITSAVDAAVSVLRQERLPSLVAPY